MIAKDEGNLILKVIEYALSKDTFTLEEMEKDFKDYVGSWSYIRNTLVADNARQTNPNHIIVISNPKYNGSNMPDPAISKYRLLPSAYFSYIDHLEVVEARKAAKSAKVLSWIAIGISLGLGVLQIYLELKRNC